MLFKWRDIEIKILNHRVVASSSSALYTNLNQCELVNTGSRKEIAKN
jgi:hypothetical protein